MIRGVYRVALPTERKQWRDKGATRCRKVSNSSGTMQQTIFAAVLWYISYSMQFDDIIVIERTLNGILAKR